MTCSGGRAPSRPLDPRRPEPNVVMKRTRVWRRNLAHSPPDCLHRNVMRDIASDRRYLTSAILIAEHESFRHAAEVMNFSQSTLSRRIQLLERRFAIHCSSATRREPIRPSPLNDSKREAAVGARRRFARTGPPLRSFAADAHCCIMVRSLTHRIQGCGAIDQCPQKRALL
jgi:hypothetical protein